LADSETPRDDDIELVTTSASTRAVGLSSAPNTVARSMVTEALLQLEAGLHNGRRYS